MSVTITSLIANHKDDVNLTVALEFVNPNTVVANVSDKYTVTIIKEKDGKWSGSSKVKVDCTCPDFMYRWSYVLGKHNALVYPEKYIDEPPKKTNPGLDLGACKHVAKVLREILKRSE